MQKQPTMRALAEQERAEHELAKRNSLVENSVWLVREEWFKYFGADGLSFTEASHRERFERYYSHNLPRGANRHAAATHEVGHYAEMQAEGFGAWRAKISGSRYEPGRWIGEATPFTAPAADRLGNHDDPSALVRYARVTLAGPYAEELFGDGLAVDNIIELLQARVLILRGSQLLGREKGELWREALECAAARVEFYRNEITAFADLLEKRREITSGRPSVKRILEAIESRPFVAGRAVSERAQHVISDINNKLREYSK